MTDLPEPPDTDETGDLDPDEVFGDVDGEPPPCDRPHDDVYVRLQSLQNVTYRHDVSTRLSRADWLELDETERNDVINEVVLGHVEATVLDEPVPRTVTRDRPTFDEPR